jgi:hypothetical protein
MAAEYRPLQEDLNEDSVNPNLPTDHQPLLNLLPPRDSASSQRPSQFIEPTTVYIQDYEQQHATATPFSCVINLANTILGTGMLAMVNDAPLFLNKTHFSPQRLTSSFLESSLPQWLL